MVIREQLRAARPVAGKSLSLRKRNFAEVAPQNSNLDPNSPTNPQETPCNFGMQAYVTFLGYRGRA